MLHCKGAVRSYQHPQLPQQEGEAPDPLHSQQKQWKGRDDVFTETSPSLDHFQRITRHDGMYEIAFGKCMLKCTAPYVLCHRPYAIMQLQFQV